MKVEMYRMRFFMFLGPVSSCTWAATYSIISGDETLSNLVWLLSKSTLRECQLPSKTLTDVRNVFLSKAEGVIAMTKSCNDEVKARYGIENVVTGTTGKFAFDPVYEVLAVLQRGVRTHIGSGSLVAAWYIFQPDVIQSVSARLEKVIKSEAFEMSISALIVVNTIIMAVETQYIGIKLGYLVRYPGFATPEHESWGSSAGETFLLLERIFTVVFTVELIIRIGILRLSFFKIPLNWLDIVVVVAGLADWMLTSLPNTTIARLLRLVKLGRGMRLVRMSTVLDSWHLILKCIASSVITLFWAFGLLGVTQCVAAMVFSQLVHPYLENSNKPLLDRQEVYSYYGTFSRSMLTMFEIMLANWTPSCRVLVNKVSESYSLVFVVYRCCAGFAGLNVINAVFIQQTLKVAQNDKDVMIMQKQRAQEEYIKKLQALFKQLDTSGDNLLSWEEFEKILTDKKLKAWLSALEGDTHQPPSGL